METGKAEARFRDNVFARHAGEESLVWCPQSGGCLVMRDAREILEEIEAGGKSAGEIAEAVAGKYEGACVEDVKEGVEAVLAELGAQGFLEGELAGDGDAIGGVANGGVRGGEASDARGKDGEEEDSSPVGAFYLRHGLPESLHVDLTDGCNERCVHCYLPKGGAHFLDTAVALKALGEFREMQGVTVMFSGGECMLHRDFRKIVEHARGLGLNVVVMTNATLCDEGMVEFLKRMRVQFVNVSLYAVEERIHDAVTQVEGSCAKTKKAIDALLAAGVPVRVATPFMKANRGRAGELKAFARERRIHLIPECDIFGSTDHSGSNRGCALSEEEFKELVRSEKELFRKGCFEEERCAAGAKVCDIGEGRLNLDAEGKYYPCDGFHGAIVGDARTMTVKEVWEGEAMGKLRALTNADFGECAGCGNRKWCKVCPMRNFNENADMFRHSEWRCRMAAFFKETYEEK